MDYKQMSFVEAIKSIAKLYSIEVQYEEESEQQRETRETKDYHIKLREAAVVKYIKARNELAEDHKAHDQLSRLSDESIEDWRIGFAPEEGNYIYNLCREKGHVEPALEAGLLGQSQDNYYDHLRGRIVFPIYDHNENLIGLSGRIYDKSKKEAKYLHSKGINKNGVLFGLHLAKKHMANNQSAI